MVTKLYRLYVRNPGKPWVHGQTYYTAERARQGLVEARLRGCDCSINPRNIDVVDITHITLEASRGR